MRRRRSENRTVAGLLGLVLVAGFAGLSACESDGGLVVTEGAAVDVEVSTEDDTTTYSWQGGNARFLEVDNLETAETVWRISAPAILDEGFPPPVIHGVRPAQASEAVAPSVLEVGVRHEVTVELVDGSEGTTEFTP